jgi:hypothetical protein
MKHLEFHLFHHGNFEDTNEAIRSTISKGRTMVKKGLKNKQRTIRVYKTLHEKLMIEQHEAHKN